MQQDFVKNNQGMWENKSLSYLNARETEALFQHFGITKFVEKGVQTSPVPVISHAATVNHVPNQEAQFLPRNGGLHAQSVFQHLYGNL